MTEIPEHLLKRSRERRSALGLGGDDGGGDAGDGGGGGAGDAAAPASTPATTTNTAASSAPAPATRASAPEPAAPPPPKPDTPVVAAYKRRRKVPFWAMLALSILPVWAFMYARAVTTQAEEAAGPLAIGEEQYGACASCHGAAGQGVAGLGYAFADREAFATFPNIEDQLRYVYYGTGEYNLAGVESYGNPDREGGPHLTGERGIMPQQGLDVGGGLTDYEILGVVCHERYGLGGGDAGGADAEEYEQWCSEDSEIFVDLESGGLLADLHDRFEGIVPIGDAPAPGLPPQE